LKCHGKLRKSRRLTSRSPNIDPYDTTSDELIPECGGIIGSAHLVEEIMEREDVKVLSY
jgi:hypothetical protein